MDATSSYGMFSAGKLLYAFIGASISVILFLIGVLAYNFGRPHKKHQDRDLLNKYIRKLKKISAKDRKGKSKKAKKEPPKKSKFAPPSKEKNEKKITETEKPFVEPPRSGHSESKPRSFSFFDRQGSRKYPIVRICFTGGPCAGKTTALAHCAQQLNQIGIKTFIIPEAITMLNNGGVTVASSDLAPEHMVKFYTNLTKTQISLEDILTDIAGDFYPDDRVVILCDRGVMDSHAYMSRKMWQAFLDETGWSNTQLRDKRYDLVLHLVTAADGAEEYYVREGRETQYEDAEEALKIDRRLQYAWVGHPNFW